VQRRTFIKTGIAGAVLLAGVGYVAAPRHPGPPAGDLQFVSAKAQAVLEALIPVVLEGSLPDDPAARATALADVLEGFDRGMQGMPPAVQDEMNELFALLTTPATRWLVAGIRSDWPSTPRDEVATFLKRWRFSRFNLLRSGYQALTQLITASWYGNPLAWGRLSYIPPQFG
jgi:hypothetical protein